MNPNDRAAGHQLLESGTLVNFEVFGTEVHEGPDPGEFGVDVHLRFPVDEESENHDLEWGGLGFLFTLGVLSFADAKPRGASVPDYIENDEFTVGDFVAHLKWKGQRLTFDVDYLRGRRVKTRITLNMDGTGILTTQGRGMAATHWLDRVQGRKGLHLVRNAQPPQQPPPIPGPDPA